MENKKYFKIWYLECLIDNNIKNKSKNKCGKQMWKINLKINLTNKYKINIKNKCEKSEKHKNKGSNSIWQFLRKTDYEHIFCCFRRGTIFKEIA